MCFVAAEKHFNVVKQSKPPQAQWSAWPNHESTMNQPWIHHESTFFLHLFSPPCFLCMAYSVLFTSHGWVWLGPPGAALGLTSHVDHDVSFAIALSFGLSLVDRGSWDILGSYCIYMYIYIYIRWNNNIYICICIYKMKVTLSYHVHFLV